MSSNSPSNPLNGGECSGKKIVSITDDVYEEMIAGIIHKCVENEHINDDSKIIILNVLPSVNFHHDAYSPEKKVLPPVYHYPQIKKRYYVLETCCKRNKSHPANQHHEMPLHLLKDLMA
jgi:hypothetical protein